MADFDVPGLAGLSRLKTSHPPALQSPKITLFLPSLAGGGAERVFVELANEFVAQGLRVDLVLACARGPYLKEILPGVRVIDFGVPGVLRSMPRLARYLRAERPDVLLSALDHANVIAILACLISRSETRCVVSARAMPTAVQRMAGSVRSWIVLQFMKVTYRFANGIIVNSNAVRSDLMKSLRLRSKPMNVIYNPLNLLRMEELSRRTPAHAWCFPDAAPIVLSVGSLAPLKDFHTLIRAFAIVRSRHNCRLVILGEGPDRPKLEHLIDELGLRAAVLLPGFIDNPFPWMHIAKVFVSSSVTEGCPNALMQAMACGTPIVSTRCAGGSAEILEGGRWGRLCPTGDANAMAQAIIASLEATHHPNVRHRASDFALHSIARQYLRILLPNYTSTAMQG